MHSRCMVHYYPAGDLPEQTLAQRLLRHTPRIQRSERPDNVWNTAFLTDMRGRYGRVIEDRVNMAHAKVTNICAKPRRQWPRVFERFPQLRLKKDRRHALVVHHLTLPHLRGQS